MPLVSKSNVVSVNKDIEALFKDLTSSQKKSVLYRAMSRAKTTLRLTASSSVQGELNVKTAPVKKAIVFLPNAPGKVEAKVLVKPDATHFIDFKGTRQLGVRRSGGRRRSSVGAGVSVQIRRGGARKILAGSFIATLRSGHKDVFKRNYNPATKRMVGRLKIHIVYSTNPRDVLEDYVIQRNVLSQGEARFVRELKSAIRYYESKRQRSY